MNDTYEISVKYTDPEGRETIFRTDGWDSFGSMVGYAFAAFRAHYPRPDEELALAIDAMANEGLLDRNTFEGHEELLDRLFEVSQDILSGWHQFDLQMDEHFKVLEESEAANA